jgi:hypothetical protein
VTRAIALSTAASACSLNAVTRPSCKHPLVIDCRWQIIGLWLRKNLTCSPTRPAQHASASPSCSKRSWSKGAFHAKSMTDPVRSSSMPPTRSTYLPIYTRATSGPAARSSATALKYGSSLVSTKQRSMIGRARHLACRAVLPQEPREDHVFEALFERCRALRIEPPSASRTDRLVRSAFTTSRSVGALLGFEQLRTARQRALEILLVTVSADTETDAERTDGRRSVLYDLKADRGAISLERAHAPMGFRQQRPRRGRVYKA